MKQIKSRSWHPRFKTTIWPRRAEMTSPMIYPHDVTRANTSELGLFNTQRPHTDGIKPKIHTVLNDETSEIERDMCAFGSIGGSAPLLSNSSGVNWLHPSARGWRTWDAGPAVCSPCWRRPVETSPCRRRERRTVRPLGRTGHCGQSSHQNSTRGQTNQSSEIKH